MAPRNSKEKSVEQRVKRATAPYLHYTHEKIKELRHSNSAFIVNNKVRQQLKQDYEALSDERKAKYVAMFEKSSKAYRKANPKVKRTKRSMQTRIQLQKIVDIVKQLSTEQRKAVIEIGFGGILDLKCTRMNKSLCNFLVQNYDTYLHCLIVHGKKLVFAPSDVEHILGLRNKGVDVVLEGSSDSSDEPCPIDGVRKGRIGLKLLYEKLRGMDSHEKEFKMTFALYILGALLCPTTVDSVSTTYLRALDPEKINSFNWAKFVLSFLENGLNKFEKNEQKSPSGCLLLLKVKYLDRVGARFEDFDVVPHFDVVPRIGAWGDNEINKRLAYIKNAGVYESESGARGMASHVDLSQKKLKRKSANSSQVPREKAYWDPTSHELFVDLCAEQVLAGNRSTTFLSKQGWENVQKTFNDRTRNSYVQTQFRDHWNELMKDWSIWRSLIHGDNGHGIDPDKGTVIASDNWWELKLQRVPDAAKFRESPLAHLSKLDIMFMDTIATRDQACTPNSGALPRHMHDANSDGEENGEDDDTQQHDDIMCDIETGSEKTRKKGGTSEACEKKEKQKGVATFAKSINTHDKIMEAVTSDSVGSVSMAKPMTSSTIRDCLDLMAKTPGIVIGDPVYLFGAHLFLHSSYREMFVELPVEARLLWLMAEKSVSPFGRHCH